MYRIKESEKSEFQKFVIDYYENQGRNFPWRTTDNSLHALVAEIMLQQTSYYQVLSPYKSFCQVYDSPEDVLEADDSEIRQYFESLGLQNRAEYIIEAAKFLSRTESITQEKLMAVKGIGRYTANAFLSIHLNRRYPIVDGNVVRVFQKKFQFEGLSASDDEVWELAWELLPERKVREYNLGLIDYGAKLYGKNPE